MNGGAVVGYLMMVGGWIIAVLVYRYLARWDKMRELAADALHRLVGDEIPPIPGMDQFELPNNNDWMMEREEPEPAKPERPDTEWPNSFDLDK